jgi:hypothetical protein
MRSLLAGMAVLALAAACSRSSAGTAASKPTTPPPSTASPKASTLNIARNVARCHAQQLIVSFRYQGVDTQHTYGAVGVTNTTSDGCAISRALTVRIYGSGARPRVLGRPDPGVLGIVVVPPQGTVWAPTDTMANNYLQPGGCRAARTVTVQIGRSPRRLPIRQSSLHGKSRIILHLCRVEMTIGPATARQA